MLGKIAILLLAFAEPTEPALPLPGLLVSVRTEGRVELDDATLDRIVSGARELWRPYADVTFLRAIEPQVIGRDKLELVITDRTLPRRDAGSVGWIEFVEGHPAQTITVSTTAARMLLEASTWNGRPLTALPLAARQGFLASALSRSIAHEIGHYLLRSREHPPRGLMRARFSAADVLQPRRINDRLDAGDVLKIRRHLIEYAGASDGRPSTY